MWHKCQLSGMALASRRLGFGVLRNWPVGYARIKLVRVSTAFPRQRPAGLVPDRRCSLGGVTPPNPPGLLAFVRFALPPGRASVPAPAPRSRPPCPRGGCGPGVRARRVLAAASRLPPASRPGLAAMLFRGRLRCRLSSKSALELKCQLFGSSAVVVLLA